MTREAMLAALEGMPVEPALALPALGLLVTAVALILWRVRRGRSGSPSRVPRQVRELASIGVPPAEIARRTGLSRDLVTMLLHTDSAAPGRQKPPHAAHSAVLRRFGFARRQLA